MFLRWLYTAFCVLDEYTGGTVEPTMEKTCEEITILYLYAPLLQSSIISTRSDIDHRASKFHHAKYYDGFVSSKISRSVRKKKKVEIAKEQARCETPPLPLRDRMPHTFLYFSDSLLTP
jgi:hypothetical protein